MATGKVYIVGAGPGDIGLFTLKGLSCIKKADTIVYDFHINAQILTYAGEETELIYAGKRGGHHELTQDEINRVLVARALEGKTVCRLKGGDPFVFGRGGEEAEVLVEHGIEFEVIPGVSSAVAAAAYAGIPLTHRGYSSSFTVVTGNEDAAKTDSTLNWAALATGPDTLVFLMAVRNVRGIVEHLIEHGKDPQTPAAVIRWGTRPDQVTVTGTLGQLPQLVKAKGIKPPSVIVIGQTVGLRDKLNWYETRPLFGQRVLITRPYTQDYEPLELMGAEIYEFPTIKTIPPESYDDLDRCIDVVEGYHWLIITSANAFKFFLQRLLHCGKDIRDLRGLKICAIGEKTAQSIREYGCRVDAVPDEFNAEGLIKMFTEARAGSIDIASLRLLLPRAQQAREVFPDMVRQLGGYIDTPTAYRAVKHEGHIKRLVRFLREGKLTVATFTSAATFNYLIEALDEEHLRQFKDITIAAIGPVTEKAITKAGFTVQIMPKKATVQAMVEAIVSHFVTHSIAYDTKKERGGSAPL
ncbi:MAG: uroporphyrinogen-III C-methyltransferase [Magnetococcales bacterium]|nr:uroporphyrinogen-III C-methyltransferase [Nitrospirota bacterium]